MDEAKPKRHAPKGRIKARQAEIDLMRADDPLRCTAHSKRTGERCTKPSIPGGHVCRYHGGSAPQVQLKGAERLQAFQDRAISRLFALAEDVNYPSTSYQAVRDVLDRTMGKAAEVVQQQHSGTLVIRHEQVG